MRKTIVACLFLANVVLFVFVLSVWNRGRALRLEVSDLTYGRIDVDGNGKYTPGDDRVFAWLLENAPGEIEKALESAVINEDGGVDLSPYLATVKH